MKVLVLVADGYEDLEVIAPVALLRRAGVSVDVYEIENKSAGKYGTIFTEVQDISKLDESEYGCLLIPGGPHVATLKKSQEVKDIVQKFYDSDRLIAAICAGPTLLGEMGLLKNRNYTCFKAMDADFGGTYEYRYVVKDGSIITGLSAAAAEAFGFVVLEEVIGKEDADALKASIYYD